MSLFISMLCIQRAQMQISWINADVYAEIEVAVRDPRWKDLIELVTSHLHCCTEPDNQRAAACLQRLSASADLVDSAYVNLSLSSSSSSSLLPTPSNVLARLRELQPTANKRYSQQSSVLPTSWIVYLINRLRYVKALHMLSPVRVSGETNERHNDHKSVAPDFLAVPALTI